MTIRIVVILSLLISSFTVSYGQTPKLETFSENPQEFLKEMRQYMTASKNKKLIGIWEEFENMQKIGRFDEPKLLAIRNTADAMLKKGMSRSPYFTKYLTCLAKSAKDINTDRNVLDWLKVLDGMMADMKTRKFQPYSAFLKFSEPFFEEKKLRASKSGSNWKTLTDKFEWKYQEGEPTVVFPETDLMCFRKKDSIYILKTSGTFYAAQNIWKGTGGKVTWERHGLGEYVYAEIGDYEFEAKSTLYEVENAKLYYPAYFGTKVIEGSFTDKLSTGNKASGTSYPRFQSKEQIVKIEKIGRGIEYTGGFKLNGTTVYGNGTKDVPALLTINSSDDKQVFKGLAEVFVIKQEELITAERTKTTVYFKNDSIAHPSSNLRFDIPEREIQLQRGKRASDRAPFYSSLHQVNINSDDIIYKFDKDSIFIGKPTVQVGNPKENEVIFESFEYFREREFTKMQNIASINPVSIIKMVAEEEGKRVDANYLAKRMDPKFDVDNIKGLLYQLVEEGFVDYDSDNEIVIIKDKVKHFGEANAGNVDYDYLKLKSKTSKTNASLNTANSQMRITGISNVEFSGVQKVALLPLGDEVTMKGNRDMDFNGKVFAGFSHLIGNDMHFKYDPYHIEMDSVLFFDLYIPYDFKDEKTNKDIKKGFAVNSRIENFSGVLLIDAPANKSGKEDIGIFPSLQSKSPSHVYYDRGNAQGDVYKRDSFYFRLKPFSFNSLDNYTEADVKFGGDLNSMYIFPEFEESLIMMPDSSLGVSTMTPSGGYDVYIDKGKYTGAIDLSNAGLLGKGKIDYLGAEINSEDIIFKPYKLTSTAERFDLDEVRNTDPEFPQAKGSDVSIEWKPYKDSMYIRTKEERFQLYKADEHELSGLLILTPGGLKGVGDLEWSKAKMKSDLFNFGAYSVTADTTNVNIKAFDADEFALSTSNLNADVDFDKQLGLFTANDEFLETTLPYNQYQTTMNEFTWDMKNQTVEFAALEGKLGTFTSIHPDQDSLFFKGKTAFYDLKSNQLSIGGVPQIRSCDAFIYTENGDVEILPGGVMTTINNAKIVADTINKNHVINRATVDVLGRKDYKGSGYYEYNIADKEQEIFFSEIIGARVGKGARGDKATETRASGTVEEAQEFYIDNKTKFLGDIGLQSSSKNLRFDGFAKLDIETLPGHDWFSVSSESAKEDLEIKFDVQKSLDGTDLHTGLFLSKETALMYPRVLQPLFFRKDRPILPVKGLFKYDKRMDQFIFADSAKMKKIALKGNKIVFNNKTGKVDMEGKFNIGSGLKYLDVTAVGSAKSSFEKQIAAAAASDSTQAVGYPFEVTANLMAGINLKFPERLMKMIVKDIRAGAGGVETTAINYNNDKIFYKKCVAELVSETSKEYSDVVSGINVGAFDLPKKVNDYSLFFSKLPMKWDPDYQSFVSSEGKLGLYSIAGEPLNLMITAYVEFKMPTDGDDRLYVYFKSPSGYYYFFGYKQGILNVVSDNPGFNDEVINMKKKEAVVKMGDDEFFEIFPVEPSSANMFVRRVQAAISGDK